MEHVPYFQVFKIAKFKHAKLNTDIENSNHRKKYHLEIATTVYRICIDNITCLKLVILVSSVLYLQ